MTTEQQRQEVLQGKNPIVNEIMDFLLGHGWFVDRIIKIVASKVYGPNQATLWVTFDSEFDQYWVKPDYRSCGLNVLSSFTISIPGSTSKEDREKKLKAFISEIEIEINTSFAVRHLGR